MSKVKKFIIKYKKFSKYAVERKNNENKNHISYSVDDIVKKKS